MEGGNVTRDELKEQIANLVVDPPMDCHITDGYWLADQILALPEIKRGLELVRIAEAIATRKKEMGNGKR
jgi:hypothetical protein